VPTTLGTLTLVKELEKVARNLKTFTERLSKSHKVELREVGELIKTLGEVGKDVIGTIVVKLGKFFDGKKLGERIIALH
jgi:archaellum component FlaC